ncbi:DUF4381 domain-containing protein [Chelatococcus reniformis]|uniref:DUF4381 domain-containing protein n=1 Tax=Chelatococcus reniformis TaxID=1494448 RepID=A0A916XL82_9HYPH|nr:DUF4381 domain-containing protein [Chelatococcus reniformis]GGC79412.1 hypothetical protein GCM10010994_41860 [Chelatococcus reniformis]
MSGDPADLSLLRDIAVPAPVAYWPPAPGWWILAAALTAVLLIGLAAALARYRRDAYRRQALAELDAIGPVTTPAAAQRLSAVLKRAALVAYPRQAVASLTGSAWLGFLDRTGGTDAFSRGAGRQLTAAALGAGAPADGTALARAARQWLARHRPAEGGEGC